MRLLKAVEIYQVNGGCDCQIGSSGEMKMVNISGDPNCIDRCLQAYISASFWEALASNGASIIKTLAIAIGVGVLVGKIFRYVDSSLPKR